MKRLPGIKERVIGDSKDAQGSDGIPSDRRSCAKGTLSVSHSCASKEILNVNVQQHALGKVCMRGDEVIWGMGLQVRPITFSSSLSCPSPCTDKESQVEEDDPWQGGVQVGGTDEMRQQWVSEAAEC